RIETRGRESGRPSIDGRDFGLSRIDVRLEPRGNTLKAPPDQLALHFVEGRRVAVDSNSAYRRIAEACLETPELAVHIQPDAFRRHVARIENQNAFPAISRADK